jgi:hypothetical protein
VTPKRKSWREVTDVPPEILAQIEQRALELAAAGEQRVGVKRLLEEARAEARVSVNNTLAPKLADYLVSTHATLGPLIERRARGVRSAREPQIAAPRPPRSGRDVLVELVGLLDVLGATFRELVVETADGPVRITRPMISAGEA